MNDVTRRRALTRWSVSAFPRGLLPVLLAGFLALAVLVFGSPPGAKTELTVWGMGMEGKLMTVLTDEFERLHPEIKVHVQAIPWGAGHEKLVTGVVGNMTPDVCQMGTTWMAEFREMNALEPLDPFLAESGISGDEFFPGTLGTNRIDGTWFGLPWYVDTRLFYYRSDILASAGFAVFPRTWEEFGNLCETLKQAEPNRFPFNFSFSDSLEVMMFLWQRRADILGGNGTFIAGPPEAVRETFDWLQMVHDKRWAPFGTDSRDDFYEAFAAGSFTMTIGGPWLYWEFERRLPNLKGRWTTACLPAEKNRLSFLGGSNLVMFRSCRNKKAAWELIEFLLREESQVKWFQTSRALPPMRKTWEHPTLAAETYLAAFRQQLEEARSPPCVPEWEQMAERIGRTVEEMLWGRFPASAAVSILEERLQQVLEREALFQPHLLRVNMLGVVLVAALILLVLYFRPAFRGLTALQAWRLCRLPAAFLAPALVLLLTFRFLPILGSFLASLTDWDLYGVADPSKVMFVGLQNYRNLWSDQQFWRALQNTLTFALLGVPLNLGLAMATALALHGFVGRLQTVFRTAFFLPVVSTLVAVSIIWSWMFQYSMGPLNRALAVFGLGPFDWLGDPRLALFSLVLVAVWKNFGYNMVVFFVSRQAIDEALYEAARIDGASPWQQLRHVTLPQMGRAIAFAGVVTGIGFLQVFTEPYVITGGGPQESTLTLVLYLYHHGFRFFRVGYASAIGFALFSCSLVLVVIRSRLRREMR